ncbi:ead/Ea22-like family protein [Citrobacter sp. Cb023]|uniref:ead/Ea22-like family protein n=1 Tax=Citrobacter sp. Cb023 TaxID=2985020 RepID=UPI002576ADF1|nr:ead/Ea22-like family protein [Citrobacter sp. Cb023]MDM3430866.1 ead/Ea22-like family protein [Citrobacter sp. Cb023]
MTALNKQALREAAENATAGQWVVELGDEVYAVDGDDSEQIAMVFSDNGRSDAAFIAAASPVAVLSLLDENLQLQRDKGSLEAVAIAMRDDMREAREKLEAAENNLIDSECHAAELEESLRDKQALLEALDNSLCELLPGTQYMDPPDGGSVTPLEQVRRMVDDYRDRIAVLSASHSKLRDTMAGIHNTIRMDGGYTPLAAILNAAKRAHEESATAAGIGVKGE